MDNSLSLAEIDRIIGNLIGKEAEQNTTLLPDEHQSFISDLSALADASGPRGAEGLLGSPNVSAHFEDIPAVEASPLVPLPSVLSPALQRLLRPKSISSPNAGVDPSAHDSPTDVPSYVSPPPKPAGVCLLTPALARRTARARETSGGRERSGGVPWDGRPG